MLKLIASEHVFNTIKMYTSRGLHPSLDYYFTFGKKPDRFLALGMEDAIKRVFHAAEREKRHRCHDTDVNTDISAFNVMLEIPG